MAKQAEKQILEFNNFLSGLAESPFAGIKGSFAKAVGIDYRSIPGIIKAHQKLKKDSGTTITELITCVVHTSSGWAYFFGGSGGIYKRTAAGVWSKLGTVTGTPKILGCAEHSDGYVYFTYSSKVGRIKISDDAITESWNDLTNANTNYGPVIYHEARDSIFIGNQELVAKVSAASAFTANALDLQAKYEIRDLAPYDIDVLVGATNKGPVSSSMIFQWDGTSTTWDYSWLFGEKIKWMLNKQEEIYILGSDTAKIYKFGDLSDPEKQVPGDYTSAAIFESNPNAKCIYDGLILFGLHDGSTGNPAPNGVYSYGTKDKEKFPKALSCDYPISSGDLDGLQIGCVSTNGSNLFVSWKDKAGTTYGVDVIDFSNKYASAYIEFLVMRLDRYILKTFDRFPCAFKPLPASCTLALKRKVDFASSWSSAIATVNTENATDDLGAFKGDSVPDGYTIQLRLEFGVNSNNSPEVENLGIVWIFHAFE
jgi:hypothetical protein